MTVQFFIIGAPKCGTTSLARWLAEHPEIFFTPIKEPHFFSTSLANRVITSDGAYRRLFDGVGPTHRAVGEASTWYLYCEAAIPNILRVLPEARFIIMTRDPVEMARSLHHHNLRVLHEDESDFARAWALQADRRSGRQIPANCIEPAFLQYGAACSLGHQIERLLSLVVPERVFHLSLEELRTDPARHYRRALAFLGLADDGRKDFPIANPARGHRSRALQRLIRMGGRLRLALGIQRGFGLARINDRAQSKAPLAPELHAELCNFFADDQAILRKSLARLAGSKHED